MYKMNLQSFKSAVTGSSKMVYTIFKEEVHLTKILEMNILY